MSAAVFRFGKAEVVRFFAESKDLRGLAAVAVDGDSFAFELVGKEVCFADVFGSCAFGQIDCFAHGIVAVFLPGGLHFDVRFRGDFVGGFEELLEVFWDFFDFLDAARACDFHHKAF